MFPIKTRGIVGGNIWWVKRKGIQSICINRTIKSMHLPVWRNCSKRQTY